MCNVDFSGKVFPDSTRFCPALVLTEDHFNNIVIAYLEQRCSALPKLKLIDPYAGTNLSIYVVFFNLTHTQISLLFAGEPVVCIPPLSGFIRY